MTTLESTIHEYDRIEIFAALAKKKKPNYFMSIPKAGTIIPTLQFPCQIYHRTNESWKPLYFPEKPSASDFSGLFNQWQDFCRAQDTQTKLASQANNGTMQMKKNTTTMQINNRLEREMQIATTPEEHAKQIVIGDLSITRINKAADIREQKVKYRKGQKRIHEANRNIATSLLGSKQATIDHQAASTKRRRLSKDKRAAEEYDDEFPDAGFPDVAGSVALYDAVSEDEADPQYTHSPQN